MTTPADIRLRHVVEQCAVALTDADGRFRKNDLIEAVLEHLGREDLAPDLMVAALSKLAQSAVTGWGRNTTHAAGKAPAASSTLGPS